MREKLGYSACKGAVALVAVSLLGPLLLLATPRSALAQCTGVNTTSVLCDAGNQAAGGTLATTNAGSTTVNINAGGKIDTGGANASVTGAGNSLTFHNNDTTFGIVNGAGAGVTLSSVGGALILDGSGAVSGTNTGIIANATGAGTVAVTSSAVTATAGIGIYAAGANGLVTVNGQGAVNATGGSGIQAVSTGTGGIAVSTSAAGTINTNSNGILAQSGGTAGNVTVTTAGVIGGGTAVGGRGIEADITNAANAGTVNITANGNVNATNVGIFGFSAGTGGVTVTGSGNVTGTIGIAATQANNVAGTNAGVHIGGSGAATATGGVGISTSVTGANNAGNVLVDRTGNVTGTTGGITALTLGSGSVTVTAGGLVTSTAGTGITAAQINNVAGTNAGVTVGGSGSVNATGGSGIDARVSGASNTGSVIVNSTGTVTATGVGIVATASGGGNVTVTGTGNVSGGNFGIQATALGGNGNILIAPAGPVSGASGISGTAVGSGASTVNIAHDVTGTAGDGVRAITAAGLSAVNVAAGTVRGTLNGIAATSASGNINVTAGAGVVVEGGTGAGMNLTGGTTNTVANNGAISGGIGLRTSAGSTTISNAGSIAGTGGTALLLAGANNLFVMDGPGAALTGSAIGSGTDTFRLGGNGSNAFDLSRISTGWTLLDKAGSSTWTLTGTATYAGPTTVSAGTVLVNGSLASSSGVTVASGATIGGTGTLPSTTINSGGMIAPGNSIGTLNIAGPVTFNAGSIYQVEANAAGQADKILATGAATINGGTVQVLAAPGNYGLSTNYTILQATNVTGTFSGVTSDLAFLTASLAYTPTDVTLTLARNVSAFASVAQTFNQRAVGGALDASPFGSTLVQAILPLTASQARQAFDQLSGEVHASAAGALVDESQYVRAAVLGRLRQASYSGDANMASLSMGGPQTSFAGEELDAALGYAKSPMVTKAPMIAPAASHDVVFWSQGFGAWGKFNSDGNAAALSRDLAGFISGFDARFGNWRGGIAAGYTNSRNNTEGRGSATVESGHVAAYGGWSFGALNLRGGGAFAFHAIDTDRTIALPGFFDRTTAQYDGRTGQVFGEMGYGFAFGKLAVEPFAGAAWVRLDTDAFSEKGGAAALHVAANSFEVGYSTLGVRAAGLVALDNGMVVIPRASAAWQHAFNSVTPDAAVAFQSTAATFVVAGVPIARDALLAEAGLDLAINRNATIGVSYTGQIASNVADHAAKGKFSWKF